jgi:hypothetical protein
VIPFLTGLVERATLRAAVLERRPRSLFEPVAGALEGPVYGPAAITGADPAAPSKLDERVGPTARDDAPRAPGREPATAGDPGANLPRIEQSEAAEAPRRPARSDAPGLPAGWSVGDAGGEGSAAPSHGEREPAARLDTALAPAVRGPRPLPSGRPPSAIPVRASAPPPLEHNDEVGHGPPRARNAHAAASRAAAPAPVTPGTRAPLLGDGPPLAGPLTSSVRSHAGPGAPRSNGAAAPPPAPVQVTIGRIEVRAAVQAVERPPVRRPAVVPRMSLDAYLNRRRGGSR